MGGKKSYLGWLALNSLHLLESIVQCNRSLMKAFVYPVKLLFVQLIALIPLLRRVDHALNEALPHNGWAKHNTHKLVNLRDNFFIKANELKIASSMSALTHHTLGHRMQGRKLHVVKFVRFRLL